MALETQILHSTEVKRAAKVIQDGGLLAFATETVYGLGADAKNGAAVAAIYAAKGRPSFNPLIIHVSDVEMAKEFAEFSPLAETLAHAFWPGPLSMVLPLKQQAGLSSLVTAGLQTVAIRVPAHDGARQLIAAFGGPIAAPSANPSGQISPTSVSHVLNGLRGKIDAVLDGGNCAVGVESTILLVDQTVALLRAGGVSVEAIEAALGGAIARPSDPQTPQSPGQMTSHYAPKAGVRINVTDPSQGEVLIAFGPVARADFNLSENGDVQEAAANLFAMLRDADALATQTQRSIAVSPVPLHGLGLAINDRLTRAAADRQMV